MTDIAFTFCVGVILYGCPFLYFTQTKNAITILLMVAPLQCMVKVSEIRRQWNTTNKSFTIHNYTAIPAHTKSIVK